jgi:hypothetical protein
MTELRFSMVSLLLRAKTEVVSLPEVVGGHIFAFVLGCVHTQNAVFSLKLYMERFSYEFTLGN